MVVEIPTPAVEPLPPLTLRDIVVITTETKEKFGDAAAAAEARGLMDA